MGSMGSISYKRRGSGRERDTCRLMVDEDCRMCQLHHETEAFHSGPDDPKAAFRWSGDEAEARRLQEEHTHHYLRWTFFAAVPVRMYGLRADRGMSARAKGARSFSASAHRQGMRRWFFRQAPWRPPAGADPQQARNARRPPLLGLAPAGPCRECSPQSRLPASVRG